MREWEQEPDRVEFKHLGFDCLMQRVVGEGRSGHWCGYVAMPKGHPWFEKEYNDIPADVHGGLTYSEHCQGKICHVTDKDDHVWWIGFDCAHCHDLTPYDYEHYPESRRYRTYKNMAYVRNQVEHLAWEASQACQV